MSGSSKDLVRVEYDGESEEPRADVREERVLTPRQATAFLDEFVHDETREQLRGVADGIEFVITSGGPWAAADRTWWEATIAGATKAGIKGLPRIPKAGEQTWSSDLARIAKAIRKAAG